MPPRCGAAQALGLADEIGSLAPGRLADICVWKPAVGPVAERRMSVARSLHEKIFAWMTLGDERNLAACFVAGRAVDQLGGQRRTRLIRTDHRWRVRAQQLAPTPALPQRGREPKSRNAAGARE